MKGDLNHVLGWNCYCDVYRWRIRNGIDVTLHSWLKRRSLAKTLSFFCFRENNIQYNGRELIIMILFTILLIIIIAIAVVVLAGVIIAGGSFIVVFCDVIVFSLIVWLIVKIFRRNKK